MKFRQLINTLLVGSLMSLTTCCLASGSSNNKIFLDEIPKIALSSLGNLASHVADASKYLALTVPERLETDHFATQSMAKASKQIYKLKYNRLTDDGLLKVLSLFVQLPNSVGMCDFTGYQILATNYLMIDGEPEELNKTKDPFARVVLHYGLKHKNHCLSNYEKAYNKLMDEHQTDQSRKELLRTIEDMFERNQLFDRITGKHGSDPLKTPLEEFKVYDDSFLLGLIENLDTGSALSSLFRKRFVNELELHEAVQTQLINDYLVKKCSEFTWFLKDIYSPARLDSLIFAGSPSDAGKGEAFRKHWQHFRVCTAINMADKVELAAKLSKLMWRRQINSN